MHYIYRIINLINGKLYIGQTNNPSLRWSQHKSSAKHKRINQVITRAMSKYGVESFIFEVIVTCLNQDATNYIEELVIKQYDTLNRNKGYNVDVGGNTTQKTIETLEKISKSLKEYYKTHDGWSKGQTMPLKWRENISKASMGKVGTNTGKSFSKEWVNNISKSLAGKSQKRKKKFSKDVEKEICRLYIEDSLSAYKLGKQFDCSRSLIAAILERNSVDVRKSNYTGHSNKYKFTLEQEQEICNKYLIGNISRSELARQYNCGKTTVRDILLRNGVDLSLKNKEKK